MKLNDIINLDESAKRALKRDKTKIKKYFRCTSGPKAGMLVSTPGQCGMRKDPRKVRTARRTSRLKKGERIRKSRITKRTGLSRLVTRLNKQT